MSDKFPPLALFSGATFARDGTGISIEIEYGDDGATATAHLSGDDVDELEGWLWALDEHRLNERLKRWLKS